MKKMTIEIKVLENNKHGDVYPDFPDFLSKVIDDLKDMFKYGKNSYLIKAPNIIVDISIKEKHLDEAIESSDELEMARIKKSFVQDFGIDITPLVKKIKRGDEVTEDEYTFSVLAASSKITYEEDLENEVLPLPTEEDNFDEEDEY